MSKAWPIVSLGELIRLERRPVEVISDQQYQEIGIYCFGRGIFHKPPRSGLEVGNKDLYLMRQGDLILQVTFAWEGAIALCSKAEDGLYGSTRYPTFRVSDDLCFPPFLARYLSTRDGLEQINKICPGSAGRNRVLSIKRIPEIMIPLPPVSEQRRIVSRIEKLASKIAEIRLLREKAVAETERLFFEACEDILTDIEPGVESRPLEALVDRGRGISYGIVQTGQETDGGVPTLRAGDLKWFTVNTVKVKQVDPEIERGYQRTRLRGGELLLRIRGGVGALAVCPKSMIGGNVSREIAVIPLTELTNPKYAMYVLAAPTNQQRMFGHTKGTSYVGINLKDVRQLPIPAISFPEQLRIVDSLDRLHAKVEALKRLQAETATELDAMLPAILDRAFKGEL
jgi:type I restriction enzyme S subunit